jgi:hypothetical protein
LRYYNKFFNKKIKIQREILKNIGPSKLAPYFSKISLKKRNNNNNNNRNKK